MLQTKEEYISEIEEVLKVLQEILAEFEKIEHHNTQTLLFHDFASRATKIGSAALRILDLDVPFAILCRVLCEDFISLYWAAQSAQNAEYYTKLVKIAWASGIFSKIKGRSTGSTAHPICQTNFEADRAATATFDANYEHDCPPKSV
jgi:hypothetical protein